MKALSRLFLFFLLGRTAIGAMDASDLEPLKSAAPGGVGPISLATLQHDIQGAVYVYGSERPDLFVASPKGGHRKAGSELVLFRWLRDSPDGVPIFSEPIVVEVSFLDFLNRGTIFQTPDKTIHGLWTLKGTLIHGILNKEAMKFEEADSLPLPKFPDGVVRSLATSPNADGSWDLALELAGDSTPGKTEEGNASTEEWRPYNSAGISTAPKRYTYLLGGRLKKPLEGPVADLRQLSPTRHEVYNEMGKITPANLGNGKDGGWITGARMGIFYYFPNVDDPILAKRWLLADPEGNVLRHPSIGPSVASYPNKDGTSSFIAAGQGDLYFYQFTNKFTDSGAPIFKNPKPLLQEQAPLSAGTLPSMTVIDWDGDGVTDIMTGNSEGFVLFFKNIGSDSLPKFLPGERVKAGGVDIQVQAGYSGSIQGIGEARWGYASPNVVDWNGDHLPDIVMGDITGNYTVYINKGTQASPSLDPSHPIFCDGVNLHGMWRVRPAVARIDGRTAMIIVDEEDNFHLYWRLDDYNVEDGGKLKLVDGSLISASRDPGGGTGRCKLDLFDYDSDGKLDLVIGTVARSAIPNKESGYPWPRLGDRRTLATPLLMRNVGSNAEPVFEMPQAFVHAEHGLVQPGGAHETGAIASALGGGKTPSLLVASQGGRLFLLQGANLRLLPPEEEEKFRNLKNPIFGE